MPGFILDPRKTAPMEARIAETLPAEKGWQFEPKWDGFRCLAFREGNRVALYAKSGKGLTVYFPEVVGALAALKIRRFVLDGELVVPLGGKLSFDALQARLHPAASRQKKLARETPALLILFDILADEKPLLASDLAARREKLEQLVHRMGAQERLRLSPYTRAPARARQWLAGAGQGALDGVIAKPLALPYAMGERVMLKVKHLKTADCVVGGFRYATGAREVGSLLLGLYDADGLLHHVGFTSGIPAARRAALTQKLEKLKGGPGFTGNAPGGPSRWSTERSSEWVPLKTRLVAEVRYDHVTGDRFRHGTKFLRWRPDRNPKSCTFDQLQVEARPSRLIAGLLRTRQG
jgi:ATP-dependent DNA ligase